MRPSKILRHVALALTLALGGLSLAYAQTISNPGQGATVVTQASTGAGLIYAGDSLFSYNANIQTGEFSSRLGLISTATGQAPAIRADFYPDATRSIGPLASIANSVVANNLSLTSGSSLATLTLASHGVTHLGAYIVLTDDGTCADGSTNGIDPNNKVLYVSAIPDSSHLTVDLGQASQATMTCGVSTGAAWLADQRTANNGNVGYAGGNFGTVGEHIEGVLDLFSPVNLALNTRSGSSGLALSFLKNAKAIEIEGGTNNVNSNNDVRVPEAFFTELVKVLKPLGKPIIFSSIMGREFPRSATLTNPATTTNGSATVSVYWPNHGLVATDSFNLSGFAAVGGVTINGAWTVLAVTDGDHFTFTAGGNASSTATGGSSGLGIFNSGPNTWAANDGRWDKLTELQNWMAANLANREGEGIYFIDCRPEMNNTGPYAQTPLLYNRDHVHLTERGAMACSKKRAAMLKRFWKTPSIPYFDPSTTNNLLPDSYFQATADGTLNGTTITGSPPHNWGVLRVGSTIGAAVTTTAGTPTAPGTATMTITSTGGPTSNERVGWQMTFSRYVTTTPTNVLSVFISNPLMRVVQSNHGAMVGANVTLSGFTSLGTITGGGAFNPNGTFAVAQVDSSSVFWVNIAPALGSNVVTGQATASGGAGTMLIDATNLMPTGSYIQLGVNVDWPAWAMLRGVSPIIYQRVGSTNNQLVEGPRPFDPASNFWPVAAPVKNFWLLTPPVQILDTSSAGAQNIRFEINFYVKMDPNGGSGAITIRQPWMKVVPDPSVFWTGPNTIPLSANDDNTWKAAA